MNLNTQSNELTKENLPFLIEIDSLIEQMANAQVPLDEGYEELLKLVQRKLNE